jgi:hypothetical protein
VSRFIETSTMTHFKALKRVLWCIKGTVDFCLFNGYSNSFELGGYSDNDWAGDIDDRKMHYIFCFLHRRHNIYMEFKEVIYSHFVNT